MNRSETIGSLAKALAAAQQEMNAAPMDGTNPHFRSKYATLASVISAVKPIHAHGLALFQTATVERMTDGVLVAVETTLAHESGEWVSNVISMRPMNDTPQAVGSAITYGRRYMAASICGIASDDDDDGNDATGKPKTVSAPKPAPQKASVPANPPASAPKTTNVAPLPPEQEPPRLMSTKDYCAMKTAEDAAKASQSGAEVAKEISEIRACAQKEGVKTANDFSDLMAMMVGRKVAAATELTAAERSKALSTFRANNQASQEAA